MYALLRPETLASIIADLQMAEDHAWIGHPSELLALDDATAELASQVGPEQADKMISSAKKELAELCEYDNRMVSPCGLTAPC